MSVLLIIFTVIIIILLAIILWMYYSSRYINQAKPDIDNITSILCDNSRLHRLLMIEIMSDLSTRPEATTFNKMAAGTTSFSNSLSSSFGITTSQKIGTLIKKRDSILREYYLLLKNSICNDDECYVEEQQDVINLSTDKSHTNTTLRVDVTTLIQKKLNIVTREIMDNITTMYHIRDKDPKNHPVSHFQRLTNLMTMYNKELVSQAKFYISHHYDISINCGQSSQDIARHVSDELSIIIKDATQKRMVTLQ